MSLIWVIALAIIGAALGSFAGAQVWRLRARQLAYEKEDGAMYDKSEYRKLQRLLDRSLANDYSRCLSCQKRLKWVDLLPIVSWVMTKGRCRYCGARIGRFELVIEILMATAFVVSYLIWPWSLDTFWAVGLLVVWLISLVVLGIMAGYDARWKLLPDSMNYLYAAFGVLFIVVRLFLGHEVSWVSVLGAIAILSGVYKVLHIVSRGAWIGLGDVKLGFGLALFLADWQLAFLALFLANFIGCLLVLPGLLRRTVQGGSQIPFGPLLMAGMIIAFFAGETMINWLLAFRFI